ncbi:hypothetical protein LEP1GSC173_0602 [Leptospira interrogans str. HAI1594]|uniref:Uncharacterized protein n=1 Tax=Leptospira interrogans serovar Icterohaemorrhagiae str. Verdun HP TaxID=1049910 RepID=M6RCI5_LEPIR|nr:hypothetical protein LEP1GSC117_4019 [Leptospira interrogans serovar Icterohaemorrhagiae str. Verdun LP]EKP77006.1 hypothetical protein LEP1GSC173_0602 [Leptospira interrogans str. HAI1594]EKR18445.1 hypothetical protein LEP1GSC019_4171 [Leptospira interrogans serovar Pyrogenes str. 2006006960]EKR26417.1 hypothetical protein LEP1GSC087_3826 [Leptospira interrogans serovar Bataviae str. L1111]EKR36428.1 hypothetical protein LEP1GSC096_3469 [Leptospira interrogans serovar Hebdomadis str. R499]
MKLQNIESMKIFLKIWMISFGSSCRKLTTKRKKNLIY